jgi:hypothetical protein
LKKFLRKLLKVFLWILGIIVGLILLLLLLIQIPAVQDFGRKEAISFLEGKFKTPVKVGKLDIDFPKKIVIEDFYFEDENQDTLAAGERLAVNINFYKLISNTIDISSIELKGAVIKIDRNQDSIFNFDYMAKAFDTGEPKDTTAVPMEISLGDIKLDRVRFKMEDAVTKMDVDLNVRHFDTYVAEFDLEKMNYGIPTINIDGLTLNINQGLLEKNSSLIGNETTPSKEDEDEAAPLNIDLGDMNLTNIRINYKSEEASINSAFTLQELKVEFNKFQFQQEFVGISNIQLTGLNGMVVFPKNSEENIATVDSTATQETSGNNWKVKVNNANFVDLAFVFKDENAPAVEQGIDYADLDLTRINLKAEDFYYSTDSISGNINSFSMQEKSGLAVNSLQTKFLYSGNGAYLKNLYLETPHTVLQDKIQLGYESLETLENNLGEVSIEANLNNSKIGFNDILILAPDLRDTNPFKSNPNAVLKIDGEVSGKINDLEINSFEASGIGNTVIAINGHITGLPEAENAYYNLKIRNFQTTAKDISEFVPEGTIPDSIQLPATFSATGNFRGSAENFDTNVNLQSSSGSAEIDATVDMRQESAERYRANVTLNNFDVGRLIKNDSIGELSLNVRVDGVGFDPATAKATASGSVDKAVYNNYVYRDLQFNGTMQDGDLNAEATMDDPNLDFDLVATGNFTGEYPSIQLQGDIRNVALDSLNLYSSPLRFEGNLTADLKTADPDYLNGEILMTNLIVQNGSQIYPLDTISIRSTASAGIDSLVLNSQFVKAKMVGDYQLTKIGTALTNTISTFYDLTAGVPDTTTVDPQQFNFELTVTDDPILNQLVPDLELAQPINVTGRFNSATDSLTVNGSIPRMKYLDYRLVNADINLETKNGALEYSVVIDDVESPQLQLYHTELEGKVQDNNISYRLRIDDSKGDPHYRVAGLMETEEDSNRFSLEIENLMLNYNIWNVPENNSITITPQGVMAENFELSYNNNAIRINSRSQDPSAPLEVEFERFRIETISAMISKDTLLIGGTINGDVVLNNLTTSPEFNSDLAIANFTFKRDTVGDLQIKVNNETANSLQANVVLTGQGNDMELSGNYNTQSGTMDFDLEMRQLYVKSIQGFSFGNLSDSKGFLSGNLDIQGTVEEPAILGGIDFNDVAFTVTPLGNYFQDMNDRIFFTQEGIRFDTFTIDDEDNNELVVNGLLATTNYTDYGFDLTVKADNFRAISSTAEDNEFYYGDLVLDTRLEIGGNVDNPVVRGSITIKDGTDLSVVLPQEDPTIADREGVVEFVDETSQRLAEMKEIEETLNTTALQGMDVSIQIEVKEEAELTLVIDEGNGDYLNLQGEAQLNAGIDPSGKTSLTGRYEFTKGAYEMSFNFIRRRFEIESGSYIQWTGEPTDANIDITAIYETETAPIDLLGNQLANLSQAVRNQYKQNIPFQTILRMQGELLEPVLSFDIRLPEGNYNVSSDIINNSRAKLAQIRQQPSELNKQVFALLLLNRFVGENPFASEAGGASAESLARQSVSKILSQQLNDLAGDLISGVKLDFDLESTEDYTTGEREQRTDLNVGLSKTLLNDRLKVTIGSSFGLEGPAQENQQANNIAGDIAVDYQLSKDGRYRLRAYRKNQYQVALQGQIIETGVAFIITLDYNHFMEIFGKDPNEDK